MNREACCLQLGRLTGANRNRSFGQWLHTGKETTAPHDRTKTSTNELPTKLKTFSSSQLQNLKDHFTNSLTKVKLRSPPPPKKKEEAGGGGGGGDPIIRCTLIEGLFSTLLLLLPNRDLGRKEKIAARRGISVLINLLLLLLLF